MESIELTQYTFNKEALASAPAEEQHLFLLAGHLLNELGCLFRLLVWSYRYYPRDKVLAMGGLANQVLTISYFISKVSEGWELVNERFTAAIQNKYIPEFQDESAASYKELKLYFGNRKSAVQQVRNNFGFHNYDDRELVIEAFNTFPADTFNIYLNEAPGQCLFHVSEIAISLGLARVIDKDIQTIDQYKEAFPRLFDEVVIAHKHLSKVLLNYQVIFVEKYIKGNCEQSVIKIQPEAKFEDIRIPFFVFPPTTNLDILD